jgi:hypothetical protein
MSISYFYVGYQSESEGQDLTWPNEKHEFFSTSDKIEVIHLWTIIACLKLFYIQKATCKNTLYLRHIQQRCVCEFWQIAHAQMHTCVRCACGRKSQCANVRACEPKIRRNSQFGFLHKIVGSPGQKIPKVFSLNSKKYAL